MATPQPILPVRFFKIIIDTNLERIKLPNKFTRIYGAGLSNPVILKPPYGPKWEVRWKKQNGSGIWLENGWKDFSENYSLCHGCLVIFTYEGDSKFDVLILGQNNLEIDYPSFDESDDDESSKISVSDDESDEISGSDEASDEISVSDNEWPVQSEQMIKGETSSARRTKSLNWPREARAKKIARAFVSTNPFITLVIKPCDLGKYRKTIHCLRGYVEAKEKDVMLYVGGRSWEVRMLCFNKPPVLHRQFSAGWIAFAQENELEPGDVCVLELTNRKDPVTFQVHVTKHNQ